MVDCKDSSGRLGTNKLFVLEFYLLWSVTAREFYCIGFRYFQIENLCHKIHCDKQSIKSERDNSSKYYYSPLSSMLILLNP